MASLCKAGLAEPLDTNSPHSLPLTVKGGDHSLEDEHATQVIHDQPVATSAEEHAHGAEEESYPEKLAERGARVDEVGGQRSHKLESVVGPLENGPRGHARGRHTGTRVDQ